MTTETMATGVEVRPMRSRGSVYKTFGTYGGGFPLISAAWEGMEHILEINANVKQEDSNMPSAKYTYTGLRCQRNLLQRHPVNILVVEAGLKSQSHISQKGEHWELMIQSTEETKRPQLIVEAWAERAINWEYGPAGKASQIRWQKQGYATRMQRVDAQDLGGAIIQPRLLVVRILEPRKWIWDTINPSSQRRPMSNLLTPPGLLYQRARQYYSKVQGNVYEAHRDPMPETPGRWIRTDRGIRRLLAEEVARGLGVPKSWHVNPNDYTTKKLQATTSVYHWEYIAQCIYQQENSRVKIESLRIKAPKIEYQNRSNCEENNQKIESVNERIATEAGLKNQTATEARLEEEQADHTNSQDQKDGHKMDEPRPIQWKPPDLSKGGVWYQARVARLKASALRYKDYHRIVAQGLEDLERHRSNYNMDGPTPTTLQLLWWEFPLEHQEDVRIGASMNFLEPPQPGLTPNSEMTDEQLVAAGEFVDELISLGVLQTPPQDRATLLNAPLFVIPKAGQPGEWRCIADMLRGGQNMCIGNDPTILPRANDILQGLYKGGYSAVVDMSKYFYQFRTRESERKWLGTIHPITGVMYEYHGLPMGSGNSPAIACRIGQGFLRMLRERHAGFKGTGSANCYWTSFKEIGFDPDKGYGFVMENEHGLVAKVWGFVDDFLIHGPTREITEQALHAFLDLACDVGFLCHPKKCTAPCQQVKYIGFLFDTRGIPVIRIPTEKQERALNMVRHIQRSHITQKFSRLVLAVVAGVLQSLVDATPSFMGNVYLRRSHNLVHPPGHDHSDLPYFSYTGVPGQVRAELEWWETYLSNNTGRAAYTQRATTLVPTWGDGSGTGTGGTLGLPDQPLQMWQGQWSPTVYRFSSNTKELATLLLTMQHLKAQASSTIAGTTIFYFTDNTTTYYIAQASSSRSPHLHDLIKQIRLIELDLDCHLQVVHVPGTVMIQQGTDSLSRGIWVSPFHDSPNQQALTASIFEPVAPDFDLIRHLVDKYQLRTDWRICDWKITWTDYKILDNFTIWFPPPELSRPLLIYFLAHWSERPWSTQALFIVPRVLAGFWQGLSKHIMELCIVNPASHPLHRSPSLPIPLVVLYLAPHLRALPTHNRLDKPPPPKWAKPHQQAAEEVRGLQAISGLP